MFFYRGFFLIDVIATFPFILFYNNVNENKKIKKGNKIILTKKKKKKINKYLIFYNSINK